MLDRIRNLAQLMKAKRAQGDKFVLMLGAGASLSSGIKPTRELTGDIVQRFGRSDAGTSPDDQFDLLWRTSNRDTRKAMLAPYLAASPSVGYRHLAELLKAGFFDIVITFNFDLLIEQALDDLGFREYRALVRGESTIDAIARMVAGREPHVKILKLHGSLWSADYFLFSREEMLNYPRDLAEVVTQLTGRDIIVCGYAFADACVIRAFNAEQDAGAIYFVNPSGATDGVKAFLAGRRSQDKVISGEYGRFDAFVGALYRELTADPAAAARTPRQNLFKFLDHYQEDQRCWFAGRRRFTRELVRDIEAPSFRKMVLSGRPKVGKTSLVRAGIIPSLDAAAFDAVLIRCRADLRSQLVSELERRFSTPLAALTFPEVFERIASITSKRVVIFLDQFERTCRAATQSKSSQELRALMTELVGLAGPRLGFVLITIDDLTFWRDVYAHLPQNQASVENKEVLPLSASRVERIVKYAARHGGVSLNPSYVKALCGEYARSLPDGAGDRRPFTLTHVQTICYYLVRGFQPTWTGVEGLPAGLQAALESLKEESNLIDLLDDLPPDERRLIRTILKAICDPDANTRKILEFLKSRFPDMKEDRYPEPIA